MMRRFEIHRSLEQEVLRLYKQAVVARRWKIAEPLMCALEQLAKSDPTCGAALDHAYLSSADTAMIEATGREFAGRAHGGNSQKRRIVRPKPAGRRFDLTRDKKPA